MKASRFLFVLLLLAAPAQAFYCNEKLVSTGDAEFVVRAACGEPDAIRPYVIYGVVEYVPLYRPTGPAWHHTRHHAETSPAIQYLVPIVREEWIYNFGPSRFVQRLTFQDGVLREIGTAGYGF